MSGLTAELAAFTSNPRFAELPPRAVEIVQSGFVDTIATMMAGRNEPVVRIVRDFVAARQSARERGLAVARPAQGGERMPR